MATRIQIRRDTSANWTASNPVLAVGEQALETDTGYMKMGDGSTVWSSLKYTSWRASGKKNALINAVGFPVNQRLATSFAGSTSTSSQAAYGLSDRWRFVAGTGATTLWTSGAPTPGAITGYAKNVIGFTRSNAGSTPSYMEQRIEDVSTFAGQQVTFSVLVDSTSGTVDFTLGLTQGFGVNSPTAATGSPSSDVTATSGTFTATTTPTVYSWTTTLASIAGQTLATNVPSIDYLAALISRPTTGNGPTTNLNVRAAQLEVGPVWTGWEVPARGEVSYQCYRYYYRLNAGSTAQWVCSWSYTGTTSGYGILLLPTPMRASPSTNVSNATHASVFTSGGPFAGVSGFSTSPGGAVESLRVTVVTGAATVGYGGYLYINNASGWLDAIAEL